MALKKKAVFILPSYRALPQNQWLPGTDRDAAVVKSILVEKFAFQEKDIKFLQGEQATKEVVRDYLNNLVREVDSKTIVFLYYSGHGAYLPSSEDEGLFLTVTKWPITSPMEEVCFTGRDFLPFLGSLSEKQTKCFFIFDCCYSGQIYRVAEFGSNERLRPKQVILDEVDSSPSVPYTKANRGGWIPEENDHFAYIAACNTVQLALEEIGKGGRLTMAIEHVLNNLENPGSVSYNTFFRLIMKEFKIREWDRYQTPQLEGSNLDNALFSSSKVIPKEAGICIKEIPNRYDVILDAGFLQNLRAGEYDVFEICAKKESVEEGLKSKDWLGTIIVNSGLIEPVQAYGCIVNRAEDKEITVGCLAYLKEAGDTARSIFIDIPDEDKSSQQVQELIKHLKATNMFTVSLDRPTTDIPDLITVSNEHFTEKREKCWVARNPQGNMIVPPIGFEHVEVMAGNLNRYIRFNIALEMAKTRFHKEDLLTNVSLKVYKVQNVKPFTRYTRNPAIQEGLKRGVEISQAAEERPTFKSHKVIEGTSTLKDESGDAFVFQVQNNNSDLNETVHICIMFYSFDGSIVPIYPKKKGHTVELRGGDIAEDILRLYIPKDSLRAMAEPDPSKDEPEFGIDTLVLYATSGPVDFGPLLQAPIKTDQALAGIARGQFRSDPLSDLKKFLNVTKRIIVEEDQRQDIKLFIKQMELTVQK